MCVLVTTTSPANAKMAELIEMLFVVLTHMDAKNHVLDGVHMGTTWQIQFNDPAAAAAAAGVVTAITIAT